MAFRIEIGLKRGVKDARGQAAVAKARRYFNLSVKSCQTRDVYKVDIPLSSGEVRKIRKAFTDPVIARSALGRLSPPVFEWMVEVGFKPGVTDNVGATARAVVQDVVDRQLPIDETVYTSVQYFFRGGDLSRDDVMRISRDLLANSLIHTVRIFTLDEWQSAPVDETVPAIREKADIRVGTYDLSGSDSELMRISSEGILSLSLST